MSLSRKIIVIPARYQSTRFPGKMLAKILGKTLIQHTYQNARKSKKIKEILIATDDKRIYKHAVELGAEVIMTPKTIPNGTVRSYQALKKYKNISKNTIVINLQGDEPLVNPRALDRLATLLEKDPSVQMATLVTPIRSDADYKDPHVVKCVFDKNKRALYFSRSPVPHTKNFKDAYQHIGIYAFRYDFLEKYCKLTPSKLQKVEDLEQLKVLEHGYSIKVVIEPELAIGVDHPSDLKKVEKHLCQ